jgi:hypothetical protein
VQEVICIFCEYDFQTCPGAHPTCCTVGTGSFPGSKAAFMTSSRASFTFTLLYGYDSNVLIFSFGLSPGHVASGRQSWHRAPLRAINRSLSFRSDICSHIASCLKEWPVPPVSMVLFFGKHKYFTFLGAFAELRKATVSFVCPYRTTRLPPDGFWWNLIFETFSDICWEKLNFIKIRQK